MIDKKEENLQFKYNSPKLLDNTQTKRDKWNEKNAMLRTDRLASKQV